MKEKEIITHRRVAEALEEIEEATWEEDVERKRLGLAPEPEGVRVPRGQKVEYLRAKREEKGKSIPDFIKKWREENGDYALRNVDVSEARIINETDIKFPVEFVDYLIDNARETLKEKGLDALGEVRTIKIKYISESCGIIAVAVRDKADNITFLDFHSVPPFDLKRVNSTMGVNTF